MLAPILLFCLVGALAVGATIALAALLAGRHNRSREAQLRGDAMRRGADAEDRRI